MYVGDLVKTHRACFTLWINPFLMPITGWNVLQFIVVFWTKKIADILIDKEVYLITDVYINHTMKSQFPKLLQLDPCMALQSSFITNCGFSSAQATVARTPPFSDSSSLPNAFYSPVLFLIVNLIYSLKTPYMYTCIFIIPLFIHILLPESP